MPKIPYDIMTNQELESGFWVDPEELRTTVVDKRKKPEHVLDQTFQQGLVFQVPRNNPEDIIDLELEQVSGAVFIFPFNVYYLEIQSSVPFGMQCHWNDPEMIPDIKSAMIAPCHMVPGVGNNIDITHGISDRMKDRYCSFVNELHVERRISYNNNLGLEFRNRYFMQSWEENGFYIRPMLSIADFVHLIFLFFLNIPPEYRTDLQKEKPSDPCLSVPKIAEEEDE